MASMPNLELNVAVVDEKRILDELEEINADILTLRRLLTAVIGLQIGIWLAPIIVQVFRQ